VKHQSEFKESANLGMIAVMSMNVGYFLSVFAGVFLGSVVFGRFMAQSAAH
jgi:solute carrier family 31 (copper transporter), member 1